MFQLAMMPDRQPFDLFDPAAEDGDAEPDESYRLLMDSREVGTNTNLYPNLQWNSEPPVPQPSHLEPPRFSRTASPSTSRTRSNSDRSEGKRPTTNFTFIPQTPNEKPAAAEVTKIRKAVMKNYLSVSGGDNRRKRPKRRSSDTTHPARSSSVAEPSRTSDGLQSTALSSAAGPSRHAKRQSTTDARLRARLRTPIKDENQFSDSSLSIELSTKEERDERALVWTHATNLLRNRVYNRAAFQTSRRLDLDRLGIRPDGGDPAEFRLDDDETFSFKLQCSTAFIDTELSQYWFQELLKSRNAFYSTLCVPAVHDQLMAQELGLISVEVLDSSRVRSRLMQMIIDSGQRGDTSTGLLISQLHAMYSELMIGNAQAIKIHRIGIDFLVNHNHVVLNPDPNGLLARTVVSVIYLTDCALELSPAKEYQRYAQTQITEPPSRHDESVDSPIYAAKPFANLSASKFVDQPMTILELCHQATSAFFTINGMRDPRRPKSIDEATQSLKLRYNNLIAFPAYKLNNPNEALCEVVRIASCIFVHALWLRIPLSQAVNERELQREPSRSHQSQHLILRFRDALKASPFQDRWDRKEKVLLWCGLVALAATSPMVKEDNPDFDNELFRARNFIAAVTLRAAIFQIFNRPKPTLGMLKRFASVQQVLADQAYAAVSSSHTAQQAGLAYAYGQARRSGD